MLCAAVNKMSPSDGVDFIEKVIQVLAEPVAVILILEGRSATARKTTVASTAQSVARAAMKDIPHDERRLNVRVIDHARRERELIETVAARGPGRG